MSNIYEREIDIYERNNNSTIEAILNKSNNMKSKPEKKENEGKNLNIVNMNKNLTPQKEELINQIDNTNNDISIQNNEYNDIIKENISLKKDNTIYKEEIEKLKSIIKKYETEINKNNQKILDLISLTESYKTVLEDKDNKISKLNETVSRIRSYNNYDSEYNLSNKTSKLISIKEYEYNNKKLFEENIKLKTEKKSDLEKINELQIINNDLNKRLKNETEQICILECKIKSMEQTLNEIKTENYNSKYINESYTYQPLNYINNNNKNDYENKYYLLLNENKNLIFKNEDYESKINNLIYENKQLLQERDKYKRSILYKENNKKQILNIFQNKIQNLKSDILSNRNKYND